MTFPPPRASDLRLVHLTDKRPVWRPPGYGQDIPLVWEPSHSETVRLMLADKAVDGWRR